MTSVTGNRPPMATLQSRACWPWRRSCSWAARRQPSKKTKNPGEKKSPAKTAGRSHRRAKTAEREDVRAKKTEARRGEKDEAVSEPKKTDRTPEMKTGGTGA